MRSAPGNGRGTHTPGGHDQPAALREGSEGAGIKPIREDQATSVRLQEAGDPERAMREALMDCYNG